MGVHERAAAARARLDRIRREADERQALRHRKTQAVRDKMSQTLRERAAALTESVKQQSEVARRREKAGGWGTEKVDSEKNFVMEFGVEGEGALAGQAGHQVPTPPRLPSPGPGGPGATEDDGGESEPVAPAAPRRRAPESQPVPERPLARKRQSLELEDDDDFSNQSTWMRKE